MIIECRVIFEVARDGFQSSVQVTEHFDDTVDLAHQAIIAINEWIRRQDHIFGLVYHFNSYIVTQYWADGQWHSPLATWTHKIAAPST